MKDLLKFNLNQKVRVQLTEAGRSELIQQARDRENCFPGLPEQEPILEDEQGWSEWSMYRLIFTFGYLFEPFATTHEIPFRLDVKLDIYS